MTTRFTHLKIAGFKSFSDPITLDILPGLTGIIGPNGCGKSNIVEAIRWVMGESSARSLRGGEMDDVIFAGTVRRAARNIAEVSLTLEGTEHVAPAPFQQQDQLQISRQLERGAGSQYRINNKVQRARDVQTFFADLGSGPRSSAIISQNRIAQLISASPEERRQVLEEAAGIAGLYSRRREAELKLKATEENLARLNDLQQQLASLIDSLNEQSSQASIYRQLSAELRETEKTLQSLYFQRAIRSLQLFKQKQQQAEITKKDTELNYNEQQTNLKYLEQKLPELRQQEIQALTQWDHQRHKTHSIQEQTQKISEQSQQLQERLQEATEQQNAAKTRVAKTQSDLNQVYANLQITEQALLEHPDKTQKIQENINNLTSQLTILTTTLQEHEKNLSEQQQCYQIITQTYEQAKQAQQNAENEYQKINTEYQQCLDQLPQEQEIQSFANTQEKARHHFQKIQEQKQQLEVQLHEAKLQASNAQYHAQQVEQTYTQLTKKIQQDKEKQSQLQTQHTTLEAQLKNLQTQTLTEQELTEFKDKLSQAQKLVVDIKTSLETATVQYQEAIKKHLEEESFYQQAVQTYENRQKNLVSVQQTFQQAQNNLDSLTIQIEKAKANLVQSEILQAQTIKFNQQKQTFDHLKENIQELTLQHQEAQKATEQAQKALYQHEADLQKLQAKYDGLAQALFHNQDQQKETNLPAVLETITIPPEWIIGVAIVFDETLKSPVSLETQTGWATLSPSNSSFPQSIPKLSDLISPPPALQRAFDHIGLVETVKEGERLFPNLNFGQSLITKEGDLWRWDGYYQKAGIQSKAAQFLLQRENLKQTEAMLAELQKLSSSLQTQYQQNQEQLQALKTQLTEKQTQYKITEQQFQTAQQELLSLKNRAQAAQTQCEALEPAYLQAQEDFSTKQKSLEQAQQESDLPKPELNSIQHSQTHLQQQKDNAQEAQKKLEIAESRLSSLKDHQQKSLNEDQQNHIRIETLQEKLTQLTTELEQYQQILSQNQEQLQQLEKPKNAMLAKEAAQKQVQALEQQLNILHKEQQQAEQLLSDAQKKHQQLKEQYIQQNSRLEILKPRCEETEKQYEATQAELKQAEAMYATRPKLEIIKDKLNSLQDSYKKCKTQEEHERLSYHLLANEKETLIKQKEILTTQIKDWENRLIQVQEEEKLSSGKIVQLQTEYTLLKQKLPNLEHQLNNLKETETQLEQLYQTAQQQLLQLEQSKGEAHKQLQQSEQNASKARENLLKAQAKQEQAEALLEQLKNNLEPTIQDYALQQNNLDISEHFEKKLKIIIADRSSQREALGAVNLRAEIERQEKQEQLTTIEKEYNELATAIQQLRDSIQKLNQQGKEKLNAVFNEVNQHFQDLFTRMFNGGSAYLKLLAHEDPLQSGLEIYAQPPGKKLSTLSLLSGGEQALTALSLVFAVSRCNPVPLCILDEVDAPLDDPNVERFCSLLSDMTAQAGTRFLVVTHHQLTMSHMNRLYGVTMQERGVSQIISIDLEHAVQMQQEKYTEQLGLI